MKRNKSFSWMLTAVLLYGLAIGFTACSDDDDVKVDERIVTDGGKIYVPEDVLTEQEQYLLDCQSAIVRTMQQLAGLDEVTPDVVNHTYEPTYGMTLDGDGSHVRVVRCDTITAAEPMFLAIAGIDSASATRLLTPTPDGYELSLKDLPIAPPDGKKFSLGTLTFHRDAGPRRYGYVEVDIPCIPHLERIDYLNPDAIPNNASGNTAYLKGDIVFVSNSSGYCSGYYLCVKQYDGFDGFLVHLFDLGGNKAGAGGDETYNLDGDGEGAFLPYNKSKGQSTNFDIIKAYARFIVDEQNKVRNIKTFLNGEGTSKKPTHAGKLGHIFPGHFNNNWGWVWAPADAYGRIWYDAIITDDYAWVPAYNYRMAYYASFRSHNSADASVSDCYIKYVRDSFWNEHWNDYSYNYCMNVIRFSTSEIRGATLEFSPTKEILKTGIPAEEATTANLGWCYADDGFLYENASKAKDAGFTPLGVLVYVNDNSDFGNMATEQENGYGHGLVMAYRNANTYSTRWNPGSGNLVEAEEGSAFTQYVNKTTGAAAALTDGNGSEKTIVLSDEGSKAAQQTLDYSPEGQGSGWMLPTAGQWIAIMSAPGLGGAKRPDASAAFPTYMETLKGDPFANINRYINDADVTRTQFKADKYWSSSAYSPAIGVYLTGGDEYGTRLTYWNAGQYAFVRPIFAY